MVGGLQGMADLSELTKANILDVLAATFSTARIDSIKKLTLGDSMSP